MSLYIRLSTQVLTDPKFLEAGPEASWLWVKGLLYSKEHLTDGFVQRAVLPLLGVGLRDVGASVDALVKAGLWSEVAGGYTVGADRWATWQMTAGEVEEKREFDRARKAEWREQKRKKHTTVPVSQECPSGTVGHVTDPVTQMSHLQSTEPESKPEHRAQSTEPEEICPDEISDNPPEDANELQCALWFADRIGQVFDASANRLIADSLKLYARDQRLPVNVIAIEVLARAKLAQENGVTINRFWFSDGTFKKRDGGVNGNGYGKQQTRAQRDQDATVDAVAGAKEILRRMVN